MPTDLLTINYDYLKKSMSHALGFPIASIEGPATVETSKSLEVEYTPDSICEALDGLLDELVELYYDACDERGRWFGVDLEGGIVFSPRFVADVSVEATEIQITCRVEQGPVNTTDAYVTFFGDEFVPWEQDYDFYGFDINEYASEIADGDYLEIEETYFKPGEEMRVSLKTVTFSVLAEDLFNEK